MPFALPPPGTRPAAIDGRGLVFVGGAMRSGTTLVQRCLDAHPAVYAGPQLLFTPTFAELYESAEAQRRGVAAPYLEDGRAEAMVRALFVESLLSVAWARGARVVAEKTPQNVLYFDALARLFPRARFVFVVRDPRAVVASRLAVKARIDQKTRRRPAPATRVALALVDEVEAHARAGRAFAAAHPERCATVRFEALLNAPERETRALAETLELEWCEAMTRPERLPLRDDEADGLWHAGSLLGEPMDPARVDAWRQELTTPLRIALESQLDRTLWAGLGYALDTHPAAALARPLAAAGRRLRRRRLPPHVLVPYRDRR